MAENGAKEIGRFGWRKAGNRVIAVEAFCDPPHKGVLAALREALRVELLLGEPLIVRLYENNTCAVEGPLELLPGALARTIDRLSLTFVHDIVAFIDDMTTLNLALVAEDALCMMKERTPETVADGAHLTIEFDHGSPLALPGDTVRSPVVERIMMRDEDSRLCRVTYPVRNLPPAVLEWGGGMKVTLPGTPAAGPLADWKQPNEAHARVLTSLLRRGLYTM